MTTTDMVHTPLTRFLSAYKTLLESHYDAMGFHPANGIDIGLKKGKKYQKLLRDRSAVAFIDENGDIYMAASYKAPAKHVRGNINSESNGMEAFGASGSVRYLR